MHAELASGYLSLADYPLRGLLVCATPTCRQQLYPLLTASEARAYRNSCGCRMRPVDAEAIERRVFEAVAIRVPALPPTDPAACHAVYRTLLIEVTVGGTVDDVQLAWRI